MRPKPAASSSNMHVLTQEYRFADPRDQRDKAYCDKDGSKPAGIPELIHQGSPLAKKQRCFGPRA